MFAVLLAVTGVSAQNDRVMKESKSGILVVCFSATGTTAAVAKSLAALSGGDFREIEPSEPYTAADLDWHDAQSRSSVEMKDPKSRPAMADMDIDIDAYDVVLIGYPIWWGVAPRVINTFIESYDLRGKVLVPFATSGGSSVGRSVSALREEYPELKWKDGRLLNTTDERTLRSWLGTLDIR